MGTWRENKVYINSMQIKHTSAHIDMPSTSFGDWSAGVSGDQWASTAYIPTVDDRIEEYRERIRKQRLSSEAKSDDADKRAVDREAEMLNQLAPDVKRTKKVLVLIEFSKNFFTILLYADSSKFPRAISTSSAKSF
jgi:hypothetical protein